MLKYTLEKPKFPATFFADNDMIALKTIKTFIDMGIRVPEHVFFIGFDDLSYSSIVSTPLAALPVYIKKW